MSSSDDNSIWISIGCSLSVLLAVSASYKFIEPNRGQDLKIHVIYIALSICCVVLLPTDIASYIFTDLTVATVASIYPAVCTPEESDDKEWLQYWMLGGVLFMLTTWVDKIMETGSKTSTVWLGSLIFASLWLYFPLTCGAALVYDKITEPLLGPKLKPLQKKMNNFIVYIYQTLANAVHLYLIWIVFMFLPAGLKRIIAIAIGTLYPFICSVTAAATDEIEDDTYWLTYWAVYGCLFLIMDLTEAWLGRIPGFYTLIIFTTVYLMLPMFRGADKVFRKVLVPLAGLQELLILRDSIQIKKQMLKDLDPERAKIVRKSIAKFFDGDDNDSDPTVLKEQYMNSWAKLPKIKLPIFGKQPTETTNLV